MDPRAGLDTLETEIYLPLLEVKTRFHCHEAHTLSIPFSFQLNVLNAITTHITLSDSME